MILAMKIMTSCQRSTPGKTCRSPRNIQNRNQTKVVQLVQPLPRKRTILPTRPNLNRTPTEFFRLHPGFRLVKLFTQPHSHPVRSSPHPRKESRYLQACLTTPPSTGAYKSSVLREQKLSGLRVKPPLISIPLDSVGQRQIAR